MKKRSLCLACVLTLALVFSTAGCGTKESPSAPTSPSASAASPSSVPEGAKPSAMPESIPASADGNVGESAEPSSKPAPETTQVTPSPTENGSKDFDSLGFQIMENDGLGAIKYRMSESALIALLGEPDSKSDAEVWGADGLEHSSWAYTSKGLEIGMAKLPDDPAAHVFSLTATAPCELSTKRGITIGSSKDDVLSAYKNEIDPTINNDTDSWITVGSAYGGMGIGIENGAVTYIFIGAAGE